MAAAAESVFLSGSFNGCGRERIKDNQYILTHVTFKSVDKVFKESSCVGPGFGSGADYSEYSDLSKLGFGPHKQSRVACPVKSASNLKVVLTYDSWGAGQMKFIKEVQLPLTIPSLQPQHHYLLTCDERNNHSITVTEMEQEDDATFNPDYALDDSLFVSEAEAEGKSEKNRAD